MSYAHGLKPPAFRHAELVSASPDRKNSIFSIFQIKKLEFAKN